MHFYDTLIITGVIYIVLVLVLTVAGSKRKIGGEPIFFISLLFTPFIGLIFLLTSQSAPRQNKPDYYVCPHCGFSFSENKQFCPVCDKDEEGKTLLEISKEYKIRKAPKLTEVPKKPKIEILHKEYNQN
jgi:hypothetical protein